MKVLQNDSTFNPIIIVLETEKEADMLWHKLNNNGRWDNYRRDHSLDFSLEVTMFNRFNEIYVPDRFNEIYVPEGEE